MNEDFSRDYFIRDMIHLVRSNENNEDSNDFIKRKDFDSRLKIVKQKCKEKYNFILSSWEGLKNCIFSLFEKIWTSEKKPEQWRDTMIVQLYKGKGDPCDFNFQKNLHIKMNIQNCLKV